MIFLFVSWQLVDGTTAGGRTNNKNNANHFTVQRQSHGLFSNRAFKGKHFKSVDCFAVFKVQNRTTRVTPRELFSSHAFNKETSQRFGLFCCVRERTTTVSLSSSGKQSQRTTQQLTSRQHNNRGLNASTCKSTPCLTTPTKTTLMEDTTVSPVKSAEGLIPQSLETSTQRVVVEQNRPPRLAV